MQPLGRAVAPGERVAMLDILRGVSVFLMVIHHFLYDLVAFCSAPVWLFKNPVFQGLIVIRYYLALRGAENGVTVKVTPFFCVQG